MSAERAPPGAEAVIVRWSRRVRVAAVVGCWILPLLMIAYLVRTAMPRDLPGVALFGAGGGAIFGYFGFVIAFDEWRIDARGLERLTRLTNRRQVAWRDVTSIDVASLGTQILVGKLPRVQLPDGMRGVDGFYRLALAHASAVLSDHARRTFERHLGLPQSLTAVPVDAPEPAAAAKSDATARWGDNPFFVLGLAPECSQAEVERGGQKLLALLAIGSAGAKRFASPLGTGDVERTAESVRAAMAELRDPERRLAHEAWARLEADPPAPPGPAPIDDPARAWPGAKAAVHLGRSRA